MNTIVTTKFKIKNYSHIAIVFQNGSSLNGAALAQTEVTLDAATIVKKSVRDNSFGC